jgi:hypothetical protein
MKVDAEAEPKEEEEVKPLEDDHGDGVSDVDSDHSEAQEVLINLYYLM